MDSSKFCLVVFQTVYEEKIWCLLFMPDLVQFWLQRIPALLGFWSWKNRVPQNLHCWDCRWSPTNKTNPHLRVHKPNLHKVGTVLVIFVSIGESLYLCLLILHAHNLEYSSSSIDFSWVELTLKTAFSISPYIFPFHWNTSISFYVSIGCKGVNKAAINKVKEK